MEAGSASATTLDDDLGQGDDHLGSWGAAHSIILDGFVYNRFAPEAESGSRRRAHWLRRTAGFQKEAWQQLIQVCRTAATSASACPRPSSATRR